VLARDVAVGGFVAAAAVGSAATRSFDWTAVSVAVIGGCAVVAAALIARSTRQKEQQHGSVSEVLAAWADVVAELRTDLATAKQEAKLMEAKAEQAFAERNEARLSLVACTEKLTVLRDRLDDT
jgi:uncharacterized protein (DUF3084 family)